MNRLRAIRSLRILPLFLAAVLSCRTPDLPPPNSRPEWERFWHGHISYPFGYRKANSDLDDARDLVNFGVLDFDLQPPGSPVALAFQVLGSYTHDVPDDSPGSPFEPADDTTVTQLNLGLRKTWYTGRWQPYLGGGVSLVDVVLSEDSIRRDSYYYDDEFDRDSDVGAWIGAGVHYSPGGGFLIGFAVQYLFDAQVELAGQDLDVGGVDFLLMLGFGF